MKQYVIDRIEDGKTAVLEDQETGDFIERPKKELPKGAKEGQVLRDYGNSLIIDHDATAERKAKLRDRFNALKKNKRE